MKKRNKFLFIALSFQLAFLESIACADEDPITLGVHQKAIEIYGKKVKAAEKAGKRQEALRYLKEIARLTPEASIHNSAKTHLSENSKPLSPVEIEIAKIKNTLRKVEPVSGEKPLSNRQAISQSSQKSNIPVDVAGSISTP